MTIAERSTTLLTPEMLQRFDERAPVYDRENRFFAEDFEELRDSGDPVALAESYSELGADELVLLDITATLEDRGPLLDLVERTAERPTFGSGQEMWDWVLYGNPISGMLVADLSEDQRARLRQVLAGMLRERAGANGRAALTNPVNIGIGTK